MCASGANPLQLHPSLLFANGTLEFAVRPDAPPAFIAHARDDPLSTCCEGPLALADAFRAANEHASGRYAPIAAPEVRLYETGEHAFGVCDGYVPTWGYDRDGPRPEACRWVDDFVAWLGRLGFR